MLLVVSFYSFYLLVFLVDVFVCIHVFVYSIVQGGPAKVRLTYIFDGNI